MRVTSPLFGLDGKTYRKIMAEAGLRVIQHKNGGTYVYYRQSARKKRNQKTNPK